MFKYLIRNNIITNKSIVRDRNSFLLSNRLFLEHIYYINDIDWVFLEIEFSKPSYYFLSVNINITVVFKRIINNYILYINVKIQFIINYHTSKFCFLLTNF